MRRSKLRQALTSPYTPLASFWVFFFVERVCDPPVVWAYVMLGALAAIGALGMWLNHCDMRALCEEAERMRREFRREERG